MNTKHDNQADLNPDLPGGESLPPLMPHQVEEGALTDSGSEPGQKSDVREENSPTAFKGAGTLPAPRQLRRLLVSLDGTPESERTLPYASELAGLLHAHLLMGHVTPTAGSSRVGQALHLPGSTRQAAEQAFEPQAMAYLQDLRWRLTTPVDQVETLHVSAPSVVEGLLQLAATSEADLVLLGLRTHMSADHMSLGSVVDNLIRRGSAPLLVIPPSVEAISRLFTLRHILVPLDGSALAEEALGMLLGLLLATEGHPGAPLLVTLLGVARTPVELSEVQTYLDSLRSVIMEMPACAHTQVNVQALVGSASGSIVGRISPHGNVDEKSDGGLQEEPVDLLIMATHGRGGMGRLLFGSVADYVLPRAQVPVLLIHPTYLNM
jgi:nucleotide-binding universal stress UspA family protein